MQALINGFFNLENFDANEYEHYEVWTISLYYSLLSFLMFTLAELVNSYSSAHIDHYIIAHAHGGSTCVDWRRRLVAQLYLCTSRASQ